MIDMRSDGGEVQYDGFEYNWRFRKQNWRAEVGALSAGGWVRRRRWIRLMVRPAQKKGEMDGREHDKAWSSTSTPIPGNVSSGHEQSPSLPPSVIYPGSISAGSVFDIQGEDVWMGEDPEDDWRRCQLLMRRLGRDGKKLEWWKRWLGVDVLQDKGKKQWTEDEEPLPPEATMQLESKVVMNTLSRPALEHIAAVIRKHVS
jgi:hypothetical protein